MKPIFVIAMGALLMVMPSCDKVKNIVGETSGKSQGESNANTFIGPVTDLDEASYDSFINQKGLLVVVNFGAAWCGPCRQLGPVLERVTEEFGETVKLGKVDVDQARSVAMRNGVRSIPDVRFFRDGTQVHQFSGAQPESRIREALLEHVVETEADQRKPESLVQRLLPDRLSEEKDQEKPEEKGASIRPMEKDWLPPGIERR